MPRLLANVLFALTLVLASSCPVELSPDPPLDVPSDQAQAAWR